MVEIDFFGARRLKSASEQINIHPLTSPWTISFEEKMGKGEMVNEMVPAVPQAPAESRSCWSLSLALAVRAVSHV